MPGGTGGETDVLLLRQAVGLGRSRSSWCLSDPVQPSWMDAAFQEAEGLLLALKSPLHFVALGVAHNQFMANKSGWRNGRWFSMKVMASATGVNVLDVPDRGSR